jgi:hypothetical protein
MYIFNYWYYSPYCSFSLKRSRLNLFELLRRYCTFTHWFSRKIFYSSIQHWRICVYIILFMKLYHSFCIYNEYSGPVQLFDNRESGGYSPLVTSLPESPVLEAPTGDLTRSLPRDFHNSLFIDRESMLASGYTVPVHSVQWLLPLVKINFPLPCPKLSGFT